MNSIIQALYGITPNSKPVEPSPGDGGYYSSFQYWNDKANNVGPPPATQGGPTALEIMQHEGMVDEGGFLNSNPNVHSIVAAMYGGGPAPVSPDNNAMNPNYVAGLQGDTLGGIGNTDGWGNDILWSTPDPNRGTYGTLGEGDTFQTPAGNYQVSRNPWGQYVLVPQDGAPGGVGPYLTNMTNGEHHIGINPQTGEVWYQKAAGYYNFSGGGDSYTQTEGAPTAPNAPGGGGGNGGNNGNSGMSWQEVLATTALANEFPAAAQRSQIDDRSLTEGLFKSLGQADSYAQMLKNLGLRG